MLQMIRPLLAAAEPRVRRSNCLKRRVLLFPKPVELEVKKRSVGTNIEQSKLSVTKSGSNCEHLKQGKLQRKLPWQQPRQPNMAVLLMRRIIMKTPQFTAESGVTWTGSMPKLRPLIRRWQQPEKNMKEKKKNQQRMKVMN